MIIRAAYAIGAVDGEPYAVGLTTPSLAAAVPEERVAYAWLTVPGSDVRIVVAIAVDDHHDTWRLPASWASWLRSIGPGISSAR